MPDKEMKRLKPCPKCGGNRIASVEDSWFFCRDCGFSCKICEGLHEAIEAWNSEGGEENEIDRC